MGRGWPEDQELQWVLNQPLWLFPDIVIHLILWLYLCSIFNKDHLMSNKLTYFPDTGSNLILEAIWIEIVKKSQILVLEE